MNATIRTGEEIPSGKFELKIVLDDPQLRIIIKALENLEGNEYAQVTAQDIAQEIWLARKASP
jgi:hypothetical protein